MAKYNPLKTYLGSHDSIELELPLKEIERIIGSKLPATASRAQWWANEKDPATRHVQRRAWRDAGYDAFLLPGRRVLFRKRDERT